MVLDIHRTHWSGLLALGFVALAGWHWWAALLLVYPLWNARSLTGWLAAIAGSTMLFPVLLYGLPVLLVAAVYTRHRLPPGAIEDTVRSRLISWIYLASWWRWQGIGARGARVVLEQAHLRSDFRAMDGAPARNEYLEIAVRYGVFGVAALVLVAWVVSRWLVPGTALGALLVTAAVICSVTSPLQAFKRWLAHGEDRPVFGPPLRCSLTVHLDHERQVHLFGIATDDREAQLEMVMALGTAAQAVAARYGIGDEVMAQWLRSHLPMEVQCNVTT